MNWETVMNKNLLRWLLDGEPWVVYRALTWLQDKAEDDDSVVASRMAIPKNPMIERIFADLNEDGYWGKPKDIHTWWPKKDTTFWLLPVLADFGFRVDDRRIAGACEYVFSTQLESGAFGWSPPTEPGDCHTAILVEAMAKLGLLNDSRLQKAYRWLVNRQRLDGGFWCKGTGLIGGPREEEPSCAFATMFALGAMGQNPKLRDCVSAKKGVSFLLDCWKNRGKVKYAGHDSEIGHGWEKLKYPFTEYRILKFLEVLSQFEHSRQELLGSGMMELLLDKRDNGGRFTPESIHRVWTDFDFGQKQRPSRWITLWALLIMKRTFK
ncbi:MAG: terpene cyclase/mutase family protein [Candidatus Thorarchaeota archaeon]|nr:MAG: terpene cyclase/mutase family protein [Candidatus Thorarchaeota archaeon]